MISLTFLKVHNGNDPRTFKVKLDLNDLSIYVTESQLLRGGTPNTVRKFSGNLVCSLVHSKENQIKQWGVFSDTEYYIGQQFCKN